MLIRGTHCRTGHETLQSSFLLICAGTGYLSNPWGQNIQSSFFSPLYPAILRVHLAWSSSGQAFRLCRQNFNQAKPMWTPEKTEKPGDCKLSRIHIPTQKRQRAFCPPRKTHLNVHRASSINSYHHFTLITEEEEVETGTPSTGTATGTLKASDTTPTSISYWYRPSPQPLPFSLLGKIGSECPCQNWLSHCPGVPDTAVSYCMSGSWWHLL